MIHLFRSAAAKLWAVSILVLILLGIGVGIARLGLPWVKEFRPEAEALAAEFFGVPVEIGGLRARMRGLTPELELQQVRLLDPATRLPQLAFHTLRAEFAPLDSLLGGALHFGEIELSGARLALWRRPDGRLGLRGLHVSDHEPLDLIQPLLRDGRLRLRDSELLLELGPGPGVPLEDLDLAIRNDGARHQLEGRAQVGGRPGAWLRFSADLQGRLDAAAGFNAEFYLKAKKLPLSALARMLPLGAYRAEAGSLELEIWGQLEGFRLRRLDGSLGLADLVLAASDEPQLRWSLDRLDTGLDWRRQRHGWRVDLTRLRLHQGAARWPGSRLAIDFADAAPEGPRLSLGADRLPIGDLATALALAPLPAEIHAALVGAVPRGELHGLQLRFYPNAEMPRWQARGAVTGLSSRPWKRVPGVSGLTFGFAAGPQAGRLDLDSRDMELALPWLFRDPLPLQELAGRLGWKRGAGGLALSAERIQASNPDLETWSRLRWERPADGTSPLLDLQVEFRNADEAAVERYLPVGIMNPRLVRWLERAVVSARVPAGTALFRGPLEAFPFEGGEGRFEAWFGLEEAVLEYLDDWPRIEGANAELRFVDNTLEIEVGDGWILGNRIEQAEVRFASLKPTAPMQVSGRLRGPFEDQLRVLRETPLEARFGALARLLRGRGESRLELGFEVPLRPGARPTRVEGDLIWDGAAALELLDADLLLSRLDGTLHFSLDGLSAKGISAQALDTEVRIDVGRIDAGHQVVARGRLAARTLAARYPDIGLEHLAGSSDWRLQLDVPDNVDGSLPTRRLQLRSDLIGMSVDLPAPLGKGAEESLTLRLATELSGEPLTRLDLRYGELVDMALVLERLPEGGSAMERCQVLFGGGSAELRASPGLHLEGRLDYLALDPWINWLQARDVGTGSGQDGAELLQGADLEVETLDTRGYRFADTRLALRAGNAAWLGRINSSRLDGDFYLPVGEGAGPLTLNLKRLDLPLTASDRPEGEAQPGPPLDPRAMPALELNLEQLSYNSEPVGSLRLLSSKRPAGLELEHLELRGPRLQVDASGTWAVGPEGPGTGLELEARSPDVGELLRTFEVNSVMEQGAAEVEASLEWPGGPLPSSLVALRGRFDFHIGAGRFLDVDPGLGRVLGLFSLSALRRRLALDFSDTFREGFAFDNIRGAFLLDGGSAYTSDSSLEGPAARIDIMGRTDLSERRYDQYVTVTPRVSSTIPVAAALAGGPGVGAAVLLAQQLVGKRLEAMASYQYQVRGPWDDPEITRIQARSRRSGGDGLGLIEQE